MTAWIRHVNGLVDELGETSLAEATEKWQSHDWDSELAHYDPEKDSSDHCLPALGVVDGEDALLDLTPFDAEHCKVNLYFHRPGKFLGFIPVTKNVWKHLPNCLRTKVPVVFGLFFDRDIEGLSAWIAREEEER